MHGRRLATTDRLLAITAEREGETTEQLRAWADGRDVELSVIGAGEPIGEAYEPNRATLGITIGDEGMFLEGIKAFAPREIPILGVSTGDPAFLARVDRSDMEDALEETVRGRAVVDSRQQIAVHADRIDATGINDVTFRHVPPSEPTDAKVTTLKLFADDEYVGAFEGTGLAVSTPTGSTGISLSAGGPVHHPVNNHSLQVVPLHTHRLGVRPAVFAPSTELHVIVGGETAMSIDGGRTHAILQQGSVVRVSGADTFAHVVRTSYDDHFFTAMATELGWGVRAPDDRGPVAALDRSQSTDAPDTVHRARDIAIEAAESAGEPLEELHGQVESVKEKTGKADIVTEADYQSDRIITTVIENEFPDHAIRSEEREFIEGDGAYEWLVDPLDGTGNFAHGNPNYSVSIALLSDSVPVVGVVHVPETDETFHAVAGEEAYVDETRLSTTDRSELDESMLLSGYDPDGSFLTRFYERTRGVRRLGSAALNLCYLASGSADAVWEYDTYPWDVAAGVVIARAAGAHITDASGDDYELVFDLDERAELLGSNGPLHPALLDHLRADADDRQ